MSRRHRAKKRVVSPDPFYDSILVHMLVNRIMKDGKKTLAYKIVYQTMQLISEKTEQNSLQILEQAIENVKPLVEVKAQRIGGSAYQVPIEVNSERGTVLAIQWILSAARNRAGNSSVLKLTNEILDAFAKTGGAIKRRTEVHRMAEANKAFAKFRF
uniref:Ribosomal protein S7 n=2 Tax=Ulva TaxID=3118 RepID=A0A4Y6A9J6_ULVCO|nr:30S ribosomal protein S7 [Ulva mutabilis]YP_009927323.1 30S ribosomal protein [Ulva compressa]ARO34821.1 30S ribosomal protein [Ulva compressa]QDE53756.1 30S ribosomal protein S7 [Ulva mutabilis]QDE53793.1 30S ribosomal protein S7 [Ulva compressa]QPF96208.1 ribosomal protein S7 [Ulva compressa]QVO50985.1 30S ribosomal protein [Ulva compressa]